MGTILDSSHGAEEAVFAGFGTHCQHSHSDQRKTLPSHQTSPMENFASLVGSETVILLIWLCWCQQYTFPPDFTHSLQIHSGLPWFPTKGHLHDDGLYLPSPVLPCWILSLHHLLFPQDLKSPTNHPALPDPTTTTGHGHSICPLASCSLPHSRGKSGSLSGSHLCVTAPLSMNRWSWRASGTRGLERKFHLRARKFGEQSFVYDKKGRLTSYLNSNVILNCQTRLNMPKFFTQNDFLNQILLILVSFRPPTKYLRKHNKYQNCKKKIDSIHMLFPQDS